MAEFAAAGEQPEFLFWVGCAGSFDDRHKKVTRAFAEILQKLGISFAVLGTEESCTGDPARRAGNEFLFQMQAMSNIEVLNLYAVKKIVTACPHCFNTLKNEYPTLGGNYEVIHHSQLLAELISSGKINNSMSDSVTADDFLSISYPPFIATSHQTLTGFTFQISLQYSIIARSDENLPMPATFNIDILVHASLSIKTRPTRF